MTILQAVVQLVRNGLSPRARNTNTNTNTNTNDVNWCQVIEMTNDYDVAAGGGAVGP